MGSVWRQSRSDKGRSGKKKKKAGTIKTTKKGMGEQERELGWGKENPSPPEGKGKETGQRKGKRIGR